MNLLKSVRTEIFRVNNFIFKVNIIQTLNYLTLNYSDS